ncbi:MAG: hypothetical protein ACI9QN_002369 [Arcticibacterium sp.]|jgi:hypothetical protein
MNLRLISYCGYLIFWNYSQEIHREALKPQNVSKSPYVNLISDTGKVELKSQ